MRKWLIPLFLLAGPARAQDALPLPAPPPPVVDLSFTNMGDRMTVPVSIAGAGPYHFLIDTGAQRTVISRELASALGLSAGRKVRLIAMTGAEDVGTALIPSLGVDKVASVRGDRIEAPLLLRAHLGALGILGVDTLQDNAVAIDFDRSVMSVQPSERRRHRRGPSQPGEIVVRARNLFGQLVVTDADFRGAKVRVVLDTGSVVSMGNEALRRLLLRKGKAEDIELISVTGDRLVAGYTQIGQVRVGEAVFQNLPVAFSADAPFRQFGLTDQPAILLGMDALRLFRRVHIDFANRELRLLMPRGSSRPGGLLQGMHVTG